MDGAKTPRAVIHPKPVRCGSVIRHIKVRRAVIVEVPKSRREALVPRRILKGFSVFLKKRPAGPGNSAKVSRTVIKIERIRFAQFIHDVVDDFDATRVAPGRDGFALDHSKGEGAAAAEE